MAMAMAMAMEVGLAVGWKLLTIMLVAFALAGCSSETGRPQASGSVASNSPGFPQTGAVDYQLGGAYDPPPGVTVVTRDSTAKPAPGVFSICYVNGFQTQPQEETTWSQAGLLLEIEGTPVADEDWPDEYLLDTSSESKRIAIADRLQPVIQECAAKGFQAIEFDNLDSDTRSHGRLSSQDNTDLAVRLATAAHRAGLLVGQKNSAERAKTLRDSAAFDFATAEECAAFAECAAYTDVYGAAVIDIEYSDTLPKSFAEVCDDPGRPQLIVLRDRGLVTPQMTGYEYRHC